MAEPIGGAGSYRMLSGERSKFDDKRELLVLCARDLAERGDAGRVSVTDVTSAMGITRGLFYYYFDGKEELGRSIADSYVRDLIEDVTHRVAEESDREVAIREVVAGVYQWLYEEEGQWRPMWRVVGALGLGDYVWRSASEGLAAVIVERGLLAKYRQADDALIGEHARFVAVGILGECRLQPKAPIDMVAEAACASLRYRKRRREELDLEEA